MGGGVEELHEEMWHLWNWNLPRRSKGRIQM